jgi:hypothetical protein
LQAQIEAEDAQYRQMLDVNRAIEAEARAKKETQ